MAWGRSLLSPCLFWIWLCQLNFYQKFWRWKLTSIELIWHLAELIESYKKNLLGGSKDEHFSCFHSSCHLGLKEINKWKFHNLYNFSWACWGLSLMLLLSWLQCSVQFFDANSQQWDWSSFYMSYMGKIQSKQISKIKTNTVRPHSTLSLCPRKT